ncbi:MAG: CHAT domain-containing protein [Planctomycetota bacterium]
MCTWNTLLGFLVLAATTATAGASPPQDLASAPQPAGACADEIRRLLQDGRPALAEAAARELLSPAALAGKDVSREAAELLRLLARAMRSNGKQEDSETRRLSELAVEIAVAAAGEPSLDVAENRFDLAILCFTLSDYPAARKQLERALQQREALLGSDHPRVAQVLTYLGHLAYSQHRDFEEAERLYARAGQIQEATLPPDHVDVAFRYSREAIARAWTGDAILAREGHERALAIYERILRPRHPLIAMQHHNVGAASIDLRDWPVARRHLEQALDMRRSELDEDHLLVAWTMTVLADVYEFLREDEEARKLWKSSLAIYERAVGPMSHSLLLPLQKIALDEINSGELQAAEEHVARAREIYHSIDSAKPTDLAWIESFSAQIALGRGERMAALVHLRHGLSAVEDVPYAGTSRADLLGDAGRILASGRDAGEIEEGVAFLEQALEIRRREEGADHPNSTWTQDQLAGALVQADRLDEAFAHALEAQASACEHLRATAAGFEERSALSSATYTMHGLPHCLRIAAAKPDPERAAQAWDALVRSRSIVFGEMIERRRLATLSKDPKVGELAQTLSQARKRYADLAVNAQADPSSAASRERLAGALQARERAERDLLEASASERASRVQSEVGFAEVARALPPGVALVSFARVGPDYLVLLSPAVSSGPEVRSLGAAEAIDGLVTSALALSRSATSEAEYRRVAAELRASIWDPIEAALAGSSEICIVPDGALVLLDFAALPIGENQYLIERAPPIHYLSTERDLLPVEGGPAGRGLLAFGGPAFDRSSESILLANTEIGGSTPPWTLRGEENVWTKPLAELRFVDLPSAASEALEIAAVWNRREDAPEAVVLTGSAATEEAFERLARGREVLHLATHGFFLPSSKGSVDPGVRGVGVGGRAPAAAFALELAPEHSLLSGLVFAGANDRSAARGSDGILLAEEISALDLCGVRLAVLSACDTGLGQVQNGEGVFGLRRAFQIAGVRTLVTSLWPVVDETAEARMIDFYRRWLEEGESVAQTLRSAALRILQDRRARGESTHPFHWAGILAVGARS